MFDPVIKRPIHFIRRNGRALIDVVFSTTVETFQLAPACCRPASTIVRIAASSRIAATTVSLVVVRAASPVRVVAVTVAPVVNVVLLVVVIVVVVVVVVVGRIVVSISVIEAIAVPVIAPPVIVGLGCHQA